jgi:hypothetical protein
VIVNQVIQQESGQPQASNDTQARTAPLPNLAGQNRQNLPAPKTPAEYEALPSGALFLDPSGAVVEKP